MAARSSTIEANRFDAYKNLDLTKDADTEQVGILICGEEEEEEDHGCL